MRRCIWLVFGVVLAMSLAGCAQQEATEAASEEAPATQEKTASDYMLDGDFSSDCPVSGTIAGAVWYDSGYQTKLTDGTLVDSDTLSIESSLTVKAASSKTQWSVTCSVVLFDGNGEYLWSYGNQKDGPTGSTSASFPCRSYSLAVAEYGEAKRFEMYVVRVDFADGLSWGFSLDDLGDVVNTQEGYNAVKKAGKLIGEGSITRNGNASGNVGAGNNTSSSNSSPDRYKQNVSDVSTDPNDCVGTWSAKTNDGTEYFTLEPLSEETGQGAVSWEQVTSHITQSRSGFWEWDDVGFVADGNTYHARITLDDYSLYADTLTDGISLNLFIPGVDEHIWSRVHEE